MIHQVLVLASAFVFVDGQEPIKAKCIETLRGLPTVFDPYCGWETANKFVVTDKECLHFYANSGPDAEKKAREACGDGCRTLDEGGRACTKVEDMEGEIDDVVKEAENVVKDKDLDKKIKDMEDNAAKAVAKYKEKAQDEAERAAEKFKKAFHHVKDNVDKALDEVEKKIKDKDKDAVKKVQEVKEKLDKAAEEFEAKIKDDKDIHDIFKIIVQSVKNWFGPSPKSSAVVLVEEPKDAKCIETLRGLPTVFDPYCGWETANKFVVTDKECLHFYANSGPDAEKKAREACGDGCRTLDEGGRACTTQDEAERAAEEFKKAFHHVKDNVDKALDEVEKKIKDKDVAKKVQEVKKQLDKAAEEFEAKIKDDKNVHDIFKVIVQSVKSWFSRREPTKMVAVVSVKKPVVSMFALCAISGVTAVLAIALAVRRSRVRTPLLA